MAEHAHSTLTPSGTGRRAVLALGGAFSALGVTAGGAASVACATGNPDAELIATCRQHVANLRAFTVRDDLGAEDDPFWAAYNDTKDVIRAAKPQTLAGMVAKAQAAKMEAATTLDGDEDYSSCPAGDWAWDLVNDLLRLSGRA